MPSKPTNINRPWIKARKPFDREFDFSKFYNDRKWRKVSTAYREANPLCECDGCKAINRVRPAQVCDHKRGLKFLIDNGFDPYDWNELQSMSNECHNKKSGSESHSARRTSKGGMG